MLKSLAEKAADGEDKRQDADELEGKATPEGNKRLLADILSVRWMG